MSDRAIFLAALPDYCTARAPRSGQPGPLTCKVLGSWVVEYPGRHRKGKRVTATSPRCDAHALQWCRTYQVPVPAQLRDSPEAPYPCPYCEATHQTGPAHVEHVKGHMRFARWLYGPCWGLKHDFEGVGGGRAVEERLAELEARVARLEDWARRTGTYRVAEA